MPYKLSDDGLTVLNSDTHDPVPGGKHDTHAEAVAHLRALEVNVDDAHKANTPDMDFTVFVPLSKVDYNKREIYGRMTQEIPDGTREVMDYASSKPLFEKWSAAAKSRTALLPEADQSLGNVRLMHQPIAVGKVIGIDYNDAEKAVDIGTHIVDDDAWDKVLKGVLTGFSVGGKYARKWADGSNLRYTADPAEVSLVDSPAVPTATFTLIKADGSEELRKIGQPLILDSPVVDGAPVDQDESVTLLLPTPDENPANIMTPADSDLNVSAPTLETVPTHEISETVAVNGNVPSADLISPHDTGSVNVPQPPAPDVMKALENSIDDLIDLQQAKSIESLLKTLGSRVGIARRSDEPLTPPQGYPTDLTKYADPANWAWLLNTSARLNTAMAEFNSAKNKGKYTASEWDVLGKRIADQAHLVLKLRYDYNSQTNTITQTKEVHNMDLNKVDLGALLSDLQRTMTAAADQIGSGDAASAQTLLMQMAGKLDTTTSGVNPVTPAPAPTGAQSGAAVSMLKADAPPPPEVEDQETTDDGEDEASKALSSKVDALTKLVAQLVERDTTPVAPLSKNAPVGDLAALLNQTTNTTPEIDPVIAALISGDKYALQKAADVAGAGGRPDMDAVLQKANAEASNSLTPVFTRMMFARGYTNLVLPNN